MKELKTTKIADFILNQIKLKKIKVGDRILSEYRLASKFNVNKSTANRAVASLVEKGILKRCPGAAGTIVAAQSLYPVGNIGFLLSIGQTSFCPRLLRGAQNAAYSRKYALQYLEWCPYEDMNAFWSAIASSKLDGLIVQGGPVPDDLPFPVLNVNEYPEQYQNQNWVVSDNYSGGKLIAEHLLKAGHREIAFVSIYSKKKSMLDRAKGFFDVLQEKSIKQLDERFFCLPARSANIGAVIESIYKRFPNITAIAFDQDSVTSRAIKYLEGKGVKIPYDISVTGFGMLQELYNHITITSINEHPFQMAYDATGLLINRIENKRKEPIQETLPVELVIGDSVSIIPN